MPDLPNDGAFTGYTIPLEEERDLAALVGIVMALHTSMEEQMRDLLRWITGMDQRYSRLLFYSLPSRARREVLIDCLALKLPKAESDDWAEFIRKKIKSASDRRNELAHHQYGGIGRAGNLNLSDPRYKPGKNSSQKLTRKGLARLRNDLGKLNRELMERIWLLEHGAPFPETAR